MPQENPAPGARAPRVSLHPLEDDIDAVVALAERSVGPVTLSAIEDALLGRGAGVLVLVLAIPFVLPIPIPLLATACGIPMILIGLKMTVTGKGALPASFYRGTLSPQTLQAVARGLKKVLRPIAWIFRPRLEIAFWPMPWRLIGVSIALAAGLLSLPIPIPFANLIPAVGLIHLAVGLLQRDGVAICVGHALTVGSYVYLYVIWDQAVALLQRLLESFGPQ